MGGSRSRRLGTIQSVGPVISDDNFTRHRVEGHRGYWGMFESDEAMESAGVFEDLGIPLIPETEWNDIIQEQQREKATIRDLCNEMGLPHKDQGRTNYCWVNGPTHCCEIVRLMETGRVVSYSPASAGAIIKGFRNVGGWGNQALEFFRSDGLNYTEDWPDNAINRSYHTDANKEKKKLHKTIEYFVLRDWAELGSSLLAGIPCAVGYNWWSHLVAATGIFPGDHDLEIRNSWANWGENGFGTLKGRRKYPDGTVAVVTMTPL